MRTLLLGLLAIGLVAGAAAMPSHANGNMPDQAMDRMQEHMPDEPRQMMQGPMNEGEMPMDEDHESHEHEEEEHNESSEEVNNETEENRPEEFHGQGERQGPPAFVVKRIPGHVLDRVPAFVFG